MRYKWFYIASLLSCQPLCADNYSIISCASTIEFTVGHFPLSEVVGTFNAIEGEIDFTSDDVTQTMAIATVKTDSVRTDDADRDANVKGPDFFDADRYPEITFKSKRIATDSGATTCIGDLTLHGVSKEIAIPFTITGPTQTEARTIIVVEGSVTIDRRDYGLVWSSLLDNAVNNDVRISLNITAERK